MDKLIYISNQKKSSLIKHILDLYPNAVPYYWDSNKHKSDYFKELDTWLEVNIVFSKDQYNFMKETFLDSNINYSVMKEISNG
jgi:hypothetical protein